MKRIGVIGSGNWGTAAARLIAENVQRLDDFDDTVKMWVFDEKINGESLVHIINTIHKNVKYHPGYSLPENLISLWKHFITRNRKCIEFFVKTGKSFNECEEKLLNGIISNICQK